MKFSIITATFNSANTISNTISGLLIQKTNADIEWIIQDNLSIDNTIELISDNITLLNNNGIEVKIYREKDNGIADAWNKGLKKSNGNIIGLLNSDDYYSHKSLQNVIDHFNDKNIDILYGKCIRMYKNGNSKIIGRKIFPFYYLWSFGFSHTTCFVKKNIFNKIGLFDTNYKIAFDYDWLIRARNGGAKFKKGIHCIYMMDGGISTKFIKKAEMEKDEVLLKNGKSKILVNTFKTLRNIYRKIKSI